MPAALSNPLMTLTALIALAGSAGPAVGADFTVPVEGVGIKGLVVDPALMTELPRQQLEASDHGTPARFEGVWLRDVLLAAGAPLGKPMHGRNIPLVVLLTARDGYAASFALAELDPAFRDKPILLADRRDGEPLSEQAGPLQLVVGDEGRAGRWIRQIERVEVLDPTGKQ
jgi:hypothetical protein